MARKKQARTLGPYEESNGKWRVIHVDNTGRRTSHFFETRQDALAGRRVAAQRCRAEQALKPLIAKYGEAVVESGQMLPRTAKEACSMLNRCIGDLTIGQVTPRRAAKLIEGDYSVATRRLHLIRLQLFWRWLVERGTVVGQSPFAGLKIEGRVNRGKAQLRIDEARRFISAALAAFDAGNVMALAPVVCLTMGLRSSEIVQRVVRDLDDGGRVLWIPDGKTKNAKRRLKVPAVLQPRLLGLTANQPPAAKLFASSAVRPNRQNVRVVTHALCDQVGAPRICPHSLRGLWATLAVESGQACEAVASALGHSSFAVTAKHYAQSGTVHDADTQRTVSELFPNRSEGVFDS